jgi:hypothetical protein
MAERGTGGEDPKGEGIEGVTTERAERARAKDLLLSRR